MGTGETYYRERQKKLYFRALMWAAGWLYRIVGGFLFRLMPCTVINREPFDRLNSQPQKGIAVPWHLCVPYGLWVTRDLGVAVMASRSNAGCVAAAIVGRLGGLPVRGGSRDGGKSALKQIVAHVNNGHWGLIVGDAPRGPRHVLKIGAILAAQETGRPIIPVSFSARWKWTLNNWDRTVLPKPFSPLIWIWGDPFYVSPHLDREGLEIRRQELEKILKENQDRAEGYWNRKRKMPGRG